MEPTIVSGAGVVVISSQPELAKKMEAAMHQAILIAQAEGITDPKEIRKRIIAAKESV